MANTLNVDQFASSQTTAMASTHNINTSRVVVDMAPEINRLVKDEVAFYKVLNTLNKESCHSTKVEWLEKRPRDWSDAVADTTVASGATSFGVSDGTIFAANDIVLNRRTLERVLVTGVSTNTLTVTRSVGATAAAGMVSGDVLDVIGSAFKQGATLGSIRSPKTDNQYNYTQIFREAFGVTGTMQNVQLYGGSAQAEKRRDHLYEMLAQIERALYWGERSIDASDTDQPRTTLGGLMEFVTTCVKDVGATLTKGTMLEFLDEIFMYGSDVKVCFGAAVIRRALHTWNIGDLQTDVDKTKAWGSQVGRLVYGDKTLYLMHSKVLDQTTTDTTNNYSWGGWGFILDLANVKLRVLGDRDIKLISDREAAGTDGTHEEYLCEISLHVENEETHGILKDIRGVSDS